MTKAPSSISSFVLAVFSTPIVFPIRVPPNSQNLFRIAFLSLLARNIRNASDPSRAFLAKSELASRTVGTASRTVEKDTRPSKNGGFTW